jgi:hypothetical protein
VIFFLTYIYNKKNIMNRMIISEEEKSRILEMHKNATSKQYLMEQQLENKLDWAKKQKLAITNLATQWKSQKIPFSPVIVGPYLLSLNDSSFSNKPEIFTKNDVYRGSITGWRIVQGFPCISPNSGYYTFGSLGFQEFNVNLDQLPNTFETLNNNLNQVSLQTLQLMWKNIAQATEITKVMQYAIAKVKEYKANPTDKAKGYDKITGTAAEFLKSITT